MWNKNSFLCSPYLIIAAVLEDVRCAVVEQNVTVLSTNFWAKVVESFKHLVRISHTCYRVLLATTELVADRDLPLAFVSAKRIVLRSAVVPFILYPSVAKATHVRAPKEPGRPDFNGPTSHLSHFRGRSKIWRCLWRLQILSYGFGNKWRAI